MKKQEDVLKIKKKIWDEMSKLSDEDINELCHAIEEYRESLNKAEEEILYLRNKLEEKTNSNHLKYEVNLRDVTKKNFIFFISFFHFFLFFLLYSFFLFLNYFVF